jgi:hypothetical protein
MTETKPKVLIVDYTYTQQNRKVTSVMAEALSGHGCEVTQPAIELTDPRCVERFSRFPMRHRIFDNVGMLPAQIRRATGEIRIPDEARGGEYDLIVIGSATWWLRTCLPIRSYLKSDTRHSLMDGKRFASFAVCRRYWKSNLKTVNRLGTDQGGTYLDSVHFTAAGGHVKSMMSLISYLGTGENASDPWELRSLRQPQTRLPRGGAHLRQLARRWPPP